MYSKDPPFEYFGLRFLMLWEMNERLIYENISDSPSEADIRKALQHFQVARTFSNLKMAKNANKIVVALKKYRKGLNIKNVVSRVNNLADTFKNDFGKRNLSAASKLLWLSKRNPVVIMDSRTVKALRYVSRTNFKLKDYGSYCKVWRSEFEKKCRDIKRAVKSLINIKNYTPAFYRSNKELKVDLNSNWFAERTFDLFLWELGDRI